MLNRGTARKLWVCITIYMIYWVKMQNIHWYQPLKYEIFFLGCCLDQTSNLICGKLGKAIRTNSLWNITEFSCEVLFPSCPGTSSVSPACQMCPPSSLVPFTFVSQGSRCNLIHAAAHNTLHGTQSQWYRAPLFHSLHLSLLFLCSLFVLPLYAWVIPNWACNWNGNHPCVPAT